MSSPPGSRCCDDDVARAFVRALERYGSFGFGLEDYRAFLVSRNPLARRPQWEDLYLALGLLRGAERAFESLRASTEDRVLRAARRIRPDPQMLEEEWFGVLASLPAACGDGVRSPLEGYQGTGSLAGYLAVILCRRLLRARRRPRALPPLDAAAPAASALEVAVTAERRQLAAEVLGRALTSLSAAEVRLLELHYLEGVPLTRAVVQCGLLPADRRFLRTAASRCHRRVVERLRRAVLRSAAATRGVRAQQLVELLDLSEDVARSVLGARRCS